MLSVLQVCAVVNGRGYSGQEGSQRLVSPPMCKGTGFRSECKALAVCYVTYIVTADGAAGGCVGMAFATIKKPCGWGTWLLLQGFGW